ncbi:MAG: hypothetical protein QM730_25100 [Anaerolineales bacterium]
MIRNRQTLAITAIAIGIVVVACNFLENTSRRVVSEHHYTIKSDTILQSLTNNEEGIFTPSDSDIGLENAYPDPISWNQSDYLKIANTFHRFIWKEPLDDWQLNSMSFTLLCNEVGNGFLQASFSYLRKNSSSQDSETEHQIDIYPRRKLINTWEFAYDSSFLKLTSTDQTKIKVAAEEALMTAENNGGSENRSAMNNDCEISVGLSQNTVNQFEWKILYSPEIFSITVDPFTGRVIK